jgi:hypothetical protein
VSSPNPGEENHHEGHAAKRRADHRDPEFIEDHDRSRNGGVPEIGRTIVGESRRSGNKPISEHRHHLPSELDFLFFLRLAEPANVTVFHNVASAWGGV